MRHFPRWTREHSEYFVDDLIALGVFDPRPKGSPPPIPQAEGCGAVVGIAPPRAQSSQPAKSNGDRTGGGR